MPHNRVQPLPYTPVVASAGGPASTLLDAEVPLLELLTGLGDGLWDWDLQADRVHYSRRFMALLGYGSVDEFQANFSFRSHLHEDDTARVTGHVAQVLDGVVPAFDAAYRLRHLSGLYRWFQGRGVVLRDGQGHALHLVGHLVDIHDRVEAHERRLARARQGDAQTAQAALTAMARGLAPGLLGVTGQIQRGVRGLLHELPASWAEHPALTDLVRLSDRGAQIADQLAVLAGQRPQRLEVVDLATRVPGWMAGLQAQAPAGVRWSIQVPAQPLKALLDVAQWRLVLQALCTNAWQALNGLDGEVQVSLQPDLHDSGVLLRVRDPGVGMAPDVLARAFDPFFTTRPAGQGVGLGLAVAKVVVQGLQGRISLHSEPSAGTEARVWLPRVAESTATQAPAVPLAQGLAAAVTAAPRSGPSAGGRHVLYVDDYEAMVYLMTRMLSRRGHRVTAFERATDALAFLAAHGAEVDLLVTDYNMPVLSGLDVVRRAKSLCPGLPAVLTSGHVTPGMSQEAMAEGVLQVLNRQDSVEEQVDTLVDLLATLPERR